jgi:hypothetical protein
MNNVDYPDVIPHNQKLHEYEYYYDYYIHVDKMGGGRGHEPRVGEMENAQNILQGTP